MAAKQTRINDEMGLREKLCEMCGCTNFAEYQKNSEKNWISTLLVQSDVEINVQNVNDDIERESAFYTSTLEAVAKAHKLLKENDISYKRPKDFFAEMLKSDAHMHKIQEKMIYERKQLEEREERHKQRELKKYGKKVQIAIQEQRRKEKKEQLDAISKWRKARKNDHTTGSEPEEFPIEIENKPEAKEKMIQNTKRKRNDARNPKNISSKRQHKNEMYGFGGKKRGLKKNTSESSSDIRDYKPKAWKQNDRNRVKKKKNHVPTRKSFKKQRPGKRRREEQRR